MRCATRAGGQASASATIGDGGARFVIHGTVPAYPDGSNPEGVAVDAAGNVYGAVVSGGGAFCRAVRR